MLQIALGVTTRIIQLLELIPGKSMVRGLHVTSVTSLHVTVTPANF